MSNNFSSRSTVSSIGRTGRTGAAVSTVSGTDTWSDEVHGTVDFTRTKGFIVDNGTGKVFRVAGFGGDYQGAHFENETELKVGTVLAGGSFHRWEMFCRGPIIPSTYLAWVSYTADDGSKISVLMENDNWNSGGVVSVTIQSPTPITCEIGSRDSAHLVKLTS